jgi:hypothetical protein
VRRRNVPNKSELSPGLSANVSSLRFQHMRHSKRTDRSETVWESALGDSKSPEVSHHQYLIITMCISPALASKSLASSKAIAKTETQ